MELDYYGVKFARVYSIGHNSHYSHSTFLLRFLFSAILILPVTLEHDYVIRNALSIHLPT